MLLVTTGTSGGLSDNMTKITTYSSGVQRGGWLVWLDSGSGETAMANE